jgi:hypothetical protein
MFEILRLLCPSSKYGGIQQKFKTSLGRIYKSLMYLGGKKSATSEQSTHAPFNNPLCGFRAVKGSTFLAGSTLHPDGANANSSFRKFRMRD